MRRLLTTCAVACVLGVAGIPAASAEVSGLEATSPTLAGWTADTAGTGTIKRVVVPDLDCRRAQHQAVGIGVGNEIGDQLPDVVAEVVMFCNDREPVYFLEVFVDGGGAASVISAGDRVSFSVTYRNDGNATVKAIDHSNPGENLTLTGAATPTALHFGAFPYVINGVRQDVPDFGTVKVVGARAAGAALTADTATKINRVEGGDLKIKSGPLGTTPTAGTFGLTFVAH